MDIVNETSISNYKGEKNKLQTLETPAGRYKWKGNRKQLMFMELYTKPSSNSFGNAYQSGLACGFSPSYSRNITNLAPSWLSEYMERVEFHPEHIKQGLQQLAIAAPNSKSPDDTRLKALEVLAKVSGMMNDKHTTNVTLVQPILSGQSIKDRPIIEQ